MDQAAKCTANAAPARTKRGIAFQYRFKSSGLARRISRTHPGACNNAVIPNRQLALRMAGQSASNANQTPPELHAITATISAIHAFTGAFRTTLGDDDED